MSEQLPKHEYRKRCIREHGEECVECGATEGIVVHHINGNRNNNDLENLIPVCDDCHRAIHSHSKQVAKWVQKLGKQPRDEADTTIQVSEEVWEHLNKQREPGDVFDDVLRQELNIKNGDDAAPVTHSSRVSAGGPTTVQVTDETWQRLNRRREPGDSMDDVISDALDTNDAAHATHE